MNIEDIVQLLTNRLREFQLSRDYAKMSGNLEGMIAADKEVLSLEDTLYKLNLLVDTTKSAAVNDEVLAEVMTDGSVAVLGEYDITPYATDPLHEQKVMNILSKMKVMDTVEKIDEYIKGKYVSSPVTGEMVMSAAEAYTVDVRLLMAMMEQDSSFGTAGKAVRTLNPGNVGNDDSGNLRTYESWQKGVTAVAEWLNRHRISDSEPTAPPIITPVDTTVPVTTSASTTPATISTTTTLVTTSTTTTPEIAPTPPVVTPVDTTAPVTTSGSTTPETAPTPPIVTPPAATTPVTTSATTTSVTTSTTTTPATSSATTTPETTPTAPPSPTPEPDDSTEETTPVTASATATAATATAN